MTATQTSSPKWLLCTGLTVLVLGKGPTQGLEHTLTAEKMSSVYFTLTKKVFCLSLHYNGANGYFLVNGKEIVKFKAKDSAIVATLLCLGNIWKDWSVNNMKKTGLNGYVYEFNVDYKPPDPSERMSKTIPLIRKYFMAKYNIKWKAWVYSGVFYRISIFIDFNKCEYVELYFNEQSRM